MEQYCHMKMNSELAMLDFDVLHEKTIEAVTSILNCYLNTTTNSALDLQIKVWYNG